jgi:hypothetical protein
MSCHLVRVLRFVALVQPPPALAIVGASAVVAFAAYTGTLEPASIENSLGITLVLQMFAASTGFRDRLCRGHFDPMLVGSQPRLPIAAAHWTMAVGPGAAAWLGVTAVAVVVDWARYPLPLTARAVVALFYVSTVAWALTLPFARLTGGTLWIVVLFVLGAARRLDWVVDVFRHEPSTFGAVVRQAAGALLVPFVLIRKEPVSLVVVSVVLGITLAVSIAGCAAVVRFDAALAEPRS